MTSTSESPKRFLDYDKSLACIHCGLCLGSCPTYLETGNENDSPRGRIYLMRAVQDGRLPLGDTAVRHIDLCLGCRACEAVCPSGVQYGDLLEHTRDHIESHYQRSTFQTFLRRIAIEKVFPFPWRMKLALLPAKVIRALHVEGLLPKFAREALSLIPADASAEPLPEVSPATGAPSSPSPPLGERAGVRGPSPQSEAPRTGFISGCVMSVLFGKTNAASVRLLNRAGYEVVTPKAQGCCGALYAHSGQLELARDCARHNIEVFEKHNLSSIVINAAGCGSTLKEYGALLRDDPKYAERARAFSSKVKDLTEVLASENSTLRNLPAVASAMAGPQSAITTTYHDACHLAHPQHITKQPRQLVRALVGGKFVELPESDVCCGSAGSYNLTEPEMAERLQKRKIENILKTGAKVVVTTNPGCLLQIRAGLKKAGAHDIEALHIADFLDRAVK
jgi:glycolate oxidase iron-sulfur subunit